MHACHVFCYGLEGVLGEYGVAAGVLQLLHGLMQGHEELGRPLLERALVIQEAGAGARPPGRARHPRCAAGGRHRGGAGVICPVQQNALVQCPMTCPVLVRTESSSVFDCP